MTAGSGERKDSGTSRWLLVSVATGGEAALRVYVWRTLRGLGAVYVQQSVCLLPDRPQVAVLARRLVDRVRTRGGSARLLHLKLTDPAEHDALVAEQRAERDVEYAEVLAHVPEFLDALKAETVAEPEADLERFDKRLAKIAARDYFGAPAGKAARRAVERCRTALTAFEDAAFAALCPQSPDGLD